MKNIIFIAIFVMAFVCASHINKSNGSISKKPVELQIEDIQFYNNFNIPRNVVIHAMPGTETAIKELIKIISYINKTEKLYGSEGYNQSIKLTILLDEKYKHTRILHRLAGVSYSKPLEKMYKNYFYPLIVTSSGLEDFIWLQDIFEFGMVKYKHINDYKPAIFNMNYHAPGKNSKIIDLLSIAFKHNNILLKGIGADPSEAGDAGGNLEVTHEGRIFVGDTMSKTLIKDLESKTGQKIIVLPTKWLQVGHVDEYLCFIPFAGETGAAVMYADPLEALKLLISSKTWRNPVARDILDSLSYFAIHKFNKTMPFDIYSFDMNKPVRKIGNETDREFGRYSDWFVLKNLEAHIEIQNAIHILKKNMKQLPVFIGIPAIFKEPRDVAFYDTFGLVMANPLTNAVVLRDHIILPKGYFFSTAKLRIANKFKNNIHFIDTSWYEKNDGGIHCATNVVRDHKYKLKQKRI